MDREKRSIQFREVMQNIAIGQHRSPATKAVEVVEDVKPTLTVDRAIDRNTMQVILAELHKRNNTMQITPLDNKNILKFKDSSELTIDPVAGRFSVSSTSPEAIEKIVLAAQTYQKQYPGSVFRIDEGNPEQQEALKQALLNANPKVEAIIVDKEPALSARLA